MGAGERWPGRTAALAVFSLSCQVSDGASGHRGGLRPLESTADLAGRQARGLVGLGRRWVVENTMQTFHMCGDSHT